MGTGSFRPFPMLLQICTVWCTKLRKHFHAIMEVFYSFTVAIGFPGDASVYNERQKSVVAARMQNKVVVEWGNSESKKWDFGYLGRTEAYIRKWKLYNVRCYTAIYENKNILKMMLSFCKHCYLTWQSSEKFFRLDVLTLHKLRWKLP